MEGMLFSKVLHMSLIGCYSMLIVGIVRLFLRRIGRIYCYCLWLIVFINLCLPFSVLSSFSLIPERLQNLAADSGAVSQDTTEEVQSDVYDEQGEIIVLPENGVAVTGEAAGTQRYDSAQVQGEQEGKGNIAVHINWKQMLPWAERIWLLGILIFAIHSIGAAVRLNRRIAGASVCQKQKSVDATVQFVELKGLDSPFLWGILHPTIYLPPNMEAEERKYIIAHENCHRKRKDYLVKIAAFAITVLHWFNPLVWIAYSLFCKDMEISCDEAVLEEAGDNIRKDYAQSLLKYAAKQNRYIMTPLTFGEPSVRSRITNVLAYRKKGIVMSAVAFLIMAVVAVGLFMRPAEKEDVSGVIGDTAMETSGAKDEWQENDTNGTEDNANYRESMVLEHQDETTDIENSGHGTAGSTVQEKLAVVNNGGELIQVGNDIFYMSGQPLYSDGSYLYRASRNEDGVEDIYQYRLDGNGYSGILEGTLIGVDADKKELYYLAEEEDGKISYHIYNTSTEESRQIYNGNGEYLGMTEEAVYIYRSEGGNLYIDEVQVSDAALEENLLGTLARAEEITSFYIGTERIVFAAGSHQGSGGFFYGDFYSYDLEAKELKQEHLTDSDTFWVYDGFMYYQKYFNRGNEGSFLYRTDLALEEEMQIGESLEFLKVDVDTNTLLVAKNGQLLRISPDGTEEKLIFDLADAEFDWDEYDTIRFKEINMIGDTIYLKAERWGYREGKGWRDSLIDAQYFQVKADGSAFQEWNPEEFLEKNQADISYLSDPMPGLPCDDPVATGWDLENVQDIRKDVTSLPWTPEPGTENNTYLLGETERYTLYGKGDYQTMLLAYDGKYAEITYDYHGSYEPLALLEADMDGDNTKELAIKFNVKHGTGLSIETFLLADVHSDGNLYVHQFLEEDYIPQLEAHLTYTKNEEGLQALVDGEPAGNRMQNEENMPPWGSVNIGNFVKFYYADNEIQISAMLQFWHEDNNSVTPAGNSGDITATVLWDGSDEFILQDFRSISRQ